MKNDKKVGLNEQDAPHKEGQYGNTSASPQAEENVSMGRSQMNEEEQKRNDQSADAGKNRERDRDGQ